MMPARPANRVSATIGTCRAMLRITSAWVALTPKAATAKAGTIVTSRRNQIVRRHVVKPYMIIWPAMMPTTELDTPERSTRPGTLSPPRRLIGGDHAVLRRAGMQIDRVWHGDGAEELGEIGGHGNHFADPPHDPDNRPGEMLAKQSGQVAVGVPPETAERDAEGLEHHVSDRTLKAFEHYLARIAKG
jgi:hypothetical protein